MPRFRLISHKLCPYVQRAVIVATEKKIPFERVDIDLAHKPDWFLAVSPTGKVPVLEVTDEDGHSRILFESAVIAEYLDEISGDRLLPSDPLDRARERAWVELASTLLNDIGQLYSAPTPPAFEAARLTIERRLAHLEPEIAGHWFAGPRFGLVDAAFGPAFRYLDIFERRTGLSIANRLQRVDDWSKSLAERPSVAGAVSAEYEELLVGFVLAKKSHLGKLLAEQALLAA